MIWELVKRDPAWKMMPYFAVISAVVWGVGSASSSEALAGTSAMTAMGLLMAYRGVNQRYTTLHATLPIAGKQLFLSRVLSLLGYIWVPILAAFAATAVGGGQGILDDRLALLALGAVITLAMMLIQCVRVDRIDPPGWLMTLVFVIAVASAPMVGLLLPDSGVAVIAAVVGGCLLASAALFLKGWAEVPKCFQLAPAQPQRAEPMAAQDSLRSEVVQTKTWWPVFRSIYFSNWRTGGLPMMFLVVAGSLIFGNMFLLFAFMNMPSSFFEYRKQLRWLWHLPISARKLLWVVWGPTTAVVVLGVTLNAGMNSLGVSSLALGHEAAVKLGQSRSWGSRYEPPVLLSLKPTPRPETLNVQVPAGYWRWARDGSVPAIVAPWGEQYQPETTLRRGFAFYNPYSVGRENSQRFLEWQFARATEAVYGQPVDVSNIDALPGMKTRMQQVRAQMIIAALVLLYLLTQMGAAHLSGWRGIRNMRAGLRILLGVTPLLAVFFLFMAPLPGSGGDFLLGSMIVHLSKVLPESLWVLGLIALAAIGGLYWIADRLWIENEFWQSDFLTRQMPEAVS